MQEEFSEALDKRFTKYAFMSLEDRALPDARDGLKPSQRRILVAMNDLKLSPQTPVEKAAKICGVASGNYHPHGESIVYPTMVRLVQPWTMRYPLLNGQGNFGNIDGDPAAAMRYVGANLSNYGASLLEDLSPQTVPFQPNYNEKLQEPTVLPAKIPNLLVNGCEGIAVGWITKILPHNIAEIANLVKAYIKNPKIKIKNILSIVPGPDFPTGGKIIGQEGIIDYYQTGKGVVLVEGVYQISKNQIIITELPYQTSPAQFCLDIEKLVQTNKIQGIQDLKNLSSKKTGIQLILELNKTTDPQIIVNNLLKHTCLRKQIHINATVLIDSKVVPETPILQLIEAFIIHRKIVLLNKFKSEKTQKEKRTHILQGLMSIASQIDLVIQIIRQSDSPEEAETNLIKQFSLSQEQTQAILAITLRQLTKLEYNKLATELETLKVRLGWLQQIIDSEEELKEFIIEEQNQTIKEFGDSRKTQIALESQKEITIQDLVKNESMTLSLTGDGYLQTETEKVIQTITINSKEQLYFLTTKGLVYQKPAFEITKKIHTGKLLNLSDNEQVIYLFKITDNELIIATKKGLIKSTPLNEYISGRKVIRGIKLIDDDLVIFATIAKKQNITFVTAKGKIVCYSTKLIPTAHRDTKGAMSMRLDNDEIVQGFDVENVADVLTITQQGYCKKISIQDVAVSNNRLVKGSNLLDKKIIDKNGALVGAIPYDKNAQMLVTTTSGKCIYLNNIKSVEIDNMDSIAKITRLI